MELKKEKQQYAMIKMPDGSVIRGKCEDYFINRDNWARVNIDGIEYKCDQSRIVIWEE